MSNDKSQKRDAEHDSVASSAFSGVSMIIYATKFRSITPEISTRNQSYDVMTRKRTDLETDVKRETWGQCLYITASQNRLRLKISAPNATRRRVIKIIRFTRRHD